MQKIAPHCKGKKNFCLYLGTIKAQNRGWQCQEWFICLYASLVGKLQKRYPDSL